MEKRMTQVLAEHLEHEIQTSEHEGMGLILFGTEDEWTMEKCEFIDGRIHVTMKAEFAIRAGKTKTKRRILVLKPVAWKNAD